MAAKFARVKMRTFQFIGALGVVAITETVGGKHDTIIIPDTGLAELSKALADIMQAGSEWSPKSKAQGDDPGPRDHC